MSLGMGVEGQAGEGSRRPGDPLRCPRITSQSCCPSRPADGKEHHERTSDTRSAGWMVPTQVIPSHLEPTISSPRWTLSPHLAG